MKKNYKFFCFLIIAFVLFLIPTHVVKAEFNPVCDDDNDFVNNPNSCIAVYYDQCEMASEKYIKDCILMLWSNPLIIPEGNGIDEEELLKCDKCQEYRKKHSIVFDRYEQWLANGKQVYPVDDDNNEVGKCYLDAGVDEYEDSVAYMIQRFFDYMKVLAPILVILLSGFDYAKTVVASDQDAMKKATNKLVTRLGFAIALYFVPFLTSFLINLVFNTKGNQTCDIK